LQQNNEAEIMQNVGHVPETMQYDENKAEIMNYDQMKIFL